MRKEEQILRSMVNMDALVKLIGEENVEQVIQDLANNPQCFDDKKYMVFIINSSVERILIEKARDNSLNDKKNPKIYIFVDDWSSEECGLTTTYFDIASKQIIRHSELLEDDWECDQTIAELSDDKSLLEYLVENFETRYNIKNRDGEEVTCRLFRDDFETDCSDESRVRLESLLPLSNEDFIKRYNESYKRFCSNNSGYGDYWDISEI